jgi:hypothetical protein
MEPRYVKGIDGKPEIVSYIVYLRSLNIDGHHELNTHLYVINNTFKYKIILGKPFLNR